MNDEAFYLESEEDSVQEALEALDAVRHPIQVGDGIEFAEECDAGHHYEGRLIFFIATYKLMITDSVTPVLSKGRGRSEHSVMLRIVMKF